MLALPASASKAHHAQPLRAACPEPGSEVFEGFWLGSIKARLEWLSQAATLFDDLRRACGKAATLHDPFAFLIERRGRHSTYGEALSS